MSSTASTTPIASVTQPKLHAARRGLFIAFFAVLFGFGGWFMSYNWKITLGIIGDHPAQTIGLLVAVIVVAGLIGWAIVSDSKRSTIGGIIAGALIVAAGFIFANQFNILAALIIIGVIVFVPVLFIAAYYTGNIKELPNFVSDSYKGVSEAWRQKRAERTARAAAGYTAMEELLPQSDPSQQPLTASQTVPSGTA
jgi:hypothetical protein